MAKEACTAGAGNELPTATQAQSVTHDSPARVVDSAPWLGGAGTMDPELPFHASAKGPGEGPDAAVAEPTALQVVWLKQSTAFNPWLRVGEVSGTFGAIVHCEPFHVSIRFRLGAPLTWPAAAQNEAPAQETDARKLPVTPLPLGTTTLTRDHDDPFHSSLKGVVVGLPKSVVPTAMPEVVVTQAMPVASMGGGLPVAGGVAAGVSDHAVPFHWLPNTIGVLTSNPVPSVSHTVVETQETEWSAAPPVTPAGITGLVSVHPVPFHVSATVPRPEDPTAMQNDDPTQDTDRSSSPLVAGTLALGTTTHDVPFHCCTRVPPPAPSFCSPTATQKVDATQETSFNWFDPEPDGAFAFDQFVALTVGGLGIPAARASGDPRDPTVRATSSPAAAVRNVRKPCIAPSLNRFKLWRKTTGVLPTPSRGSFKRWRPPPIPSCRARAVPRPRRGTRRRRSPRPRATPPTPAVSAASRSRKHGGARRPGTRSARSPSDPAMGRRSRPRPWCRHRAGRRRRLGPV